MRRIMCGLLVLAGATTACGSGERAADGAPPRALAASQTAAARALRLPTMRLAPSRAAAGATGRDIQVHVLIEGRIAGDSLIRTGTLDPACGAGFTDTLVTRNGASVVGALVWVEGPTAVVVPSGTPERRATVTLERCQLQPHMQVAPPGSTLLLVMRDPRAESLVIVPSTPAVPVDTVSFLTDGQLVPVSKRADSAGVLAIHAAQMPWARAFIAVTPPSMSTVTDVDGIARFTLDRAGRKAILRAWHPALGIVSATIDPSTVADNVIVPLTFRP